MIMDGLENIFDDEPLFSTEPELEEISNESDDSDFNFFNDDSNADEAVNPLLTELLKTKGINKPEITIIDEDGTEQTVPFNKLSLEEQLEILTSTENTDADELDTSEIDLINQLREKNWTVEDFLENYKQSILASLDTQIEENYDIDAYDDQELFVLDLKNKYDLTDEELLKELEKELLDEPLFKKKVDILRAEYKNLEDSHKEAQRLEDEENKIAEFQRFEEAMVNIAVETPEFYGIELEDSEKDEVLSFLLDADESGESKFYQTLNDPRKLYEAAWFLRYGKESFDALKNAYEAEIAKLKKSDKPTVVRKTNNPTEIKSIHEI